MTSRHREECKGLFVQIRYLKAKFTRESEFRCMLMAQKDYMLSLLARFERRCVENPFFLYFFSFGTVVDLPSPSGSEQNILLSISKIGFLVPSPPPPKAVRSLKSAALCVLFTLYTK